MTDSIDGMKRERKNEDMQIQETSLSFPNTPSKVSLASSILLSTYFLIKKIINLIFLEWNDNLDPTQLTKNQRGRKSKLFPLFCYF